MALVLNDRVRETTTVVGTGSATLAGAVTGYQAFSSIGNGNTTYYTIAGGSEWEVGIGTYASGGNTLARTTVLASSNAGALVPFSAGTKDVFVTQPAERAIYTNAAGTQIVASGNLPVTNLNSGTGASASTFWRGDGTWATPVDTGITAVSVVSANGLAGTSSGGTSPALTLSTTVTGLLKGNGTAISAASSGTDYAPATSGTSILYGNGSGGFSNVTIGSGISFVGGTLSATSGGGGTVTSVSVVSANGFAGTVATATTTPAITISTSVTGLLKGNGTSVSAAASGTDYAPATTGTSLLYGNGLGGFSNATIGTGLSFSAGSLALGNTTVVAATYGSASAVPVIVVDAQGRLTGVTNTNIAIAANQVTAGTMAINRGGTAGNATPTAGAVAYGTGTAYAFTVAGTSGQVLTSNGAAAPTWTTPATGTVTSVAALTLGTTGTDLSSTVANGTTTPVITLNVPTASASNRGALSSTDWSTFNGKIGGSGTANYVAKFNGSTTTIGNSVIYDDGTKVGVGTASPTSLLTIAGTTSAFAVKTPNILETATVSATAATGTINYDLTTQSVLYYTSNATANWTVNFRASSGTSLNTALAVGESITAVFLVTQGATAYYNNAVQIDGTSVTPKWQGGTAPTSGNASSIDVYTYSIIKTASATYTVLASQTKFA